MTTTVDEVLVDVRTWSDGGGCERRFALAAVPAEVEFLASTGKFRRIEVRAVGADEWRTVHTAS